MTTITRFAPSPNGPLHLGHAFSALVGHDLARARGGRFLLRVEDIDGARSRGSLAAEYRADLAWLGLAFEEVAPQSSRLPVYEAAARWLRTEGLIYPCSCTRAQIAADASAVGADGPIYAGTCRSQGAAPGLPIAWRLDAVRASRRTGALAWDDEVRGVQRVETGAFGDVVLVRKDAPASYHLAATLDDAADGVTLVTRGMDLFAATPVHRLLQAVFGLPVPRWRHHPLLVDESGHKLAKRRGSGTADHGLAALRAAGEDGAAIAQGLRAGRFPAGISAAST